MVKIIYSKLIQKKHELIRFLDKAENRDNPEKIAELKKVKNECNEELEKSMQEQCQVVFEKVKLVVDMKKLKKEVQGRYKEVRDKYAVLIEEINSNVKLKKEMRTLIQQLDKDMKEDKVYSQEQYEEIKNKYL